MSDIKNTTKRIKRVHFMGIKGVGMAPLAILLKEAGMEVTGSDTPEIFITEDSLSKEEIEVFTTFDSKHVDSVDLVIATGAHGGSTNVEVVAAKEKNIPVFMQGEAVGRLMDGQILPKNFKGISVAGTHGKTTTTAMIATMLKENGMNPSYLIGTSSVPSLGNSGHFGKGNYFVAEADEYMTDPSGDNTPKLLWQHPEIAVVTNIELDHPDVYPTIEALHNTFIKFMNGIKPGGKIVVCGDDHTIRRLLPKVTSQVITYGFSENNDYYIKRFTSSGEKTFFWVESKGTSLGEFVLSVTGEHNCLNALAALIVGLEVGLSTEQVKKGLSNFRGSKRRMEKIGVLESGATLYDDYAHHPTEIQKTLHGLRIQFPKKKIICIFQPHTYSRTKVLFDEFSRAFVDADQLILMDIYASKREEADPQVSSQKLSLAISNRQKNVLYLATMPDVVEYLDQNPPKSDTIVITMGAGDVYKIAEQLQITDDR